MFVRLPVQFNGQFESSADIARSWLRWFTVGLAWWVLPAVAGLLVWAGAEQGWSRLPAFSLTMTALLFTFGPFGETYVAARLTYAWNRLHLPPPVPAPPPARRFWVSAAVVAILVLASTAAHRWILGVGWDTRPLLDRWSPWTMPVLLVLGLLLAEFAVSQRMRREIRQQCCDAEIQERRSLEATTAGEQPQEQR